MGYLLARLKGSLYLYVTLAVVLAFVWVTNPHLSYVSRDIARNQTSTITTGKNNDAIKPADMVLQNSSMHSRRHPPSVLKIWNVSFPLGPLQAFEYAKIQITYPCEMRQSAVTHLLNADTLHECATIASNLSRSSNISWRGVSEQMMTRIVYEFLLRSEEAPPTNVTSSENNTLAGNTLRQDNTILPRTTDGLMRMVRPQVRNHFAGVELFPRVLLIGDSIIRFVKTPWPKACYNDGSLNQLFALADLLIVPYVSVIVFHGGAYDVSAFVSSNGTRPPSISNSSVPNESGQRFIDKCRSLQSNANADRTFTSRVRFYFTELLYRNDYGDSPTQHLLSNDLVNNFNLFLHYASTQLRDFNVISTHSQLKDKSNLGEDGLHLSSEGNINLSMLIRDAIKAPESNSSH